MSPLILRRPTMAAYHLGLCLLLLLPLSTTAQGPAAGYIPVAVGASITADGNSNLWLSQSGDFAFGFQHIPAATNDLFVLSIWFDKIPNKTVVWYERGSYPVPRGSTLRLDAQQGIVLRDPRGNLLYSSNNLVGRVVDGFMNDTGNFLLRGSDSTTLWESFNNPTDTILPNQVIQINGQIVSRRTAGNFSQGRFYGRMRSDGNFVLSTKFFPQSTEFDADYFNTQTNDVGNQSNSGYKLVFSENALLSVVRRNGQRSNLSPLSVPSASENYYRATLDFDGVFVQYYHPKNSDGGQGWTLAAAWPNNICTGITGGMGSGACGYNNICSIVNRRPVCQCPQQFSLVDPNNPYGNCEPKYVPYCIQGDRGSSSNEEYELSVISNVDWPLNDYATLKSSTEEQCRNLCLSDCFCAAAIFRSSQCWIKRLPLSNGRVDTSLDSKAFLKIRKGDATSTPSSVNPDRGSSDKRRKGQGRLILVGSVFLGSSVFINCVLIATGCIGFFFIYKKKFQVHSSSHPSTVRSNLQCFTYKELEQATKEFKEEVGRGAFAVVYKGALFNSSKSVVAVKRLNSVAESEKEFETEMNVIGQTHHKNLVRLIGFCNERPHRMLVYEYMGNGTLANFLFGDLRPKWSERTRIAVEIARGLTYLHEECTTQIIHCDIKPQNILLDECQTARISDFGLAKLLMIDESRVLTNIRGTRGYVAPEWYRNTPITVKADVYSFGVVLLEIITCRKATSQNMIFESNDTPFLSDWVLDCFMEGSVHSLVEKDEEALGDMKTVERFVMVGLWCIQEEVSMRPSMRKVCQMLEGIVKVEVPPYPYPAYSTWV